jgi:hypothetical protein
MVGRAGTNLLPISQIHLQRRAYCGTPPSVLLNGTTSKTCLKVRFHDLRHSFASHFAMKGGNIYALAKILGHSSPKMTLGPLLAPFARVHQRAAPRDGRPGLRSQPEGSWVRIASFRKCRFSGVEVRTRLKLPECWALLER